MSSTRREGKKKGRGVTHHPEPIGLGRRGHLPLNRRGGRKGERRKGLPKSFTGRGRKRGGGKRALSLEEISTAERGREEGEGRKKGLVARSADEPELRRGRRKKCFTLHFAWEEGKRKKEEERIARRQVSGQKGKRKRNRKSFGESGDSDVCRKEGERRGEEKPTLPAQIDRWGKEEGREKKKGKEESGARAFCGAPTPLVVPKKRREGGGGRKKKGRGRISLVTGTGDGREGKKGRKKKKRKRAA